MNRDRPPLADALVGWRHRLEPSAVGIDIEGSRRVAGLRREELARIAALSVDYVVRLEQGRATNPSAQTLDALARALRLTANEHALLYQLAGLVLRPVQRVPRDVPHELRNLGSALRDWPVGIFSVAWDILWWNSAWSALHGDPAPWTGHERNLVWRSFSGASSRVRHERAQRQAVQRELVADLRVAHAHYPDDPDLSALVTDLCATSSTFTRFWAMHEVGPRVDSTKTVVHPELGEITLDCAILAATGGDLKVMIFTAEPGAALDKLAALSALGT